MIKLEENMAQNLRSGFKKYVIYPLDKRVLLDRLPQNLSDFNSDIVGTSFLEQLDAKKSEYLRISNKKRRRKLQVPAGKSIQVGT